jgi:uncharacterized membrane protein
MIDNLDKAMFSMMIGLVLFSYSYDIIWLYKQAGGLMLGYSIGHFIKFIQEIKKD